MDFKRANVVRNAGYTSTHGMTLSAVSLPYYKHILPYGKKKSRRFAETVFSVDTGGMADEEAGLAGLEAMENWMRELGLIMNLNELGVTEELIKKAADVTIVLDGGYKLLSREEIEEILRESL